MVTNQTIKWSYFYDLVGRSALTSRHICEFVEGGAPSPACWRRFSRLVFVRSEPLFLFSFVGIRHLKMQHSVITVKWGRKLWNIWKRVDLHNRQPLVSLCSVIDILLWEDFIKSLNVIHYVCLFWHLFKWILNANICISCLFKEVTHKLKSCHHLFTIMSIIMIPVFSVVEHCVSRAKGCGFNSQRTHTLTIHV